MRHPCARNSTHAQPLHDLDDCHLWNVKIGQQLMSWNVRVARNQGCDVFALISVPTILSCTGCGMSSAEFCPSTNALCYWQIVVLLRHRSPYTPRISIIVSAADNPRRTCTGKCNAVLFSLWIPSHYGTHKTHNMLVDDFRTYYLRTSVSWPRFNGSGYWSTLSIWNGMNFRTASVSIG